MIGDIGKGFPLEFFRKTSLNIERLIVFLTFFLWACAKMHLTHELIQMQLNQLKKQQVSESFHLPTPHTYTE